MEQKTRLIRCGDFFFKYRNFLFPFMLVLLFISSAPPADYFGQEWIEDGVDTLALLLVFLGLALRSAVIGFRYIKRGGLNKKVYAEHLVTDGFFGVCRNPLYVANFLVCSGILAKHGSVIAFPVGMAFFTFVYIAIVAAEEYFLRNNFGTAYVEYCTDVPRWWMKWSRLKLATRGMSFSLKRAIVKDYSTITNTLFAMIALEMWEKAHYSSLGNQLEWSTLEVLLGLIVMAAISMRIAKKRGILRVSS